MYTEQQLKTYLVDWFNVQSVESRSIDTSDLPLFRLRVVLEDNGDRTLVIGSEQLSSTRLVEIEVLYVWVADRGSDLTASPASFMELVQSRHAADYLTDGDLHKFYTADLVRKTKLIGLNKYGNVSTDITAADTVIDAVGKLAGKVEDYRNRATHSGTQPTTSISGLDTKLLEITNQAANPIKTVTGTSYTITGADNGYFIEFTSSSPITVTVPTQASGQIAPTIGTSGMMSVHICQAGTGTVTVVGASGVVIAKPASMTAATMEKEAVLTLKHRTFNNWRLFGLLGAA